MTESRRTGKTTRAIDEAIQYLYTHGKVSFAIGRANVYDPDIQYGPKKVQEELMRKTLKRLQSEHKANVKINGPGMTITLEKDE
jgi:hypothetical protein